MLHSKFQSNKYPSKTYSDRYSKREDGRSRGDSPASRNSPRYLHKKPYNEKDKGRMERGESKSRTQSHQCSYHKLMSALFLSTSLHTSDLVYHSSLLCIMCLVENAEKMLFLSVVYILNAKKFSIKIFVNLLIFTW